MPTNEEMRVAAGALEKEAGKWEAEVPHLNSIKDTLTSIAFSRTEAGMFQVMFDAYEACRTTVEARAGEGATEYQGIADILRQISQAYAKQDDETAEQLAKTW